jgi:hypothetical protein
MSVKKDVRPRIMMLNMWIVLCSGRKSEVGSKELYWSEMDSVHAPFVVGDLSPQYAAEAATT